MTIHHGFFALGFFPTSKHNTSDICCIHNAQNLQMTTQIPFKSQTFSRRYNKHFFGFCTLLFPTWSCTHCTIQHIFSLHNFWVLHIAFSQLYIFHQTTMKWVFTQIFPITPFNTTQYSIWVFTLIFPIQQNSHWVFKHIFFPNTNLHTSQCIENNNLMSCS